MNVKEARAEFILTMEDACIESCEHNSKDSAEHNITIAADAYALAVMDEASALPPFGSGIAWHGLRKEIEEMGR